MDFLTVAQAAQFLSLSRHALYELIKTNKIPHYKFGPRGIRFTRSDLESWVATRRIEPAQAVRRGIANSRVQAYQHLDPATFGRPSN